MSSIVIEPKSDKERALLDLVMKTGTSGVARDDVGKALKISKPTVEKLIMGLGLKKVRNERRKEFFGIPEGAEVRNTAPVSGQTPASGTPTTTPSGSYRLPRGEHAAQSGKFQTQNRKQEMQVRDDERSVLLAALAAQTKLIEKITA